MDVGGGRRGHPRGVGPTRPSRSYCAGVTTPHGTDAPPEFRAVLDALGARRLRPEVTLREVPAPRRSAPWSVALPGEVAAARSDDPELASGRFIVLYDPAGQEAWEGRFRVVTLVRATLEPEMAAEDVLAEVGWSWREAALPGTGGVGRAEGGGVTRVLSQSFGALAGKHNDVELEMRASWTPVAPGPGTADLGDHLAAWAQLLCTAAGLPPLPEGVTPLGARPPARRNTGGSWGRPQHPLPLRSTPHPGRSAPRPSSPR